MGRRSSRLAPGSGAHIQIVDGNVYLAMSVRNAGSGIAVLHGWHLRLESLLSDHAHAERDEFRPQQRDLYIPGGDIGFWQGAIRDPRIRMYRELVERVEARAVFLIELLYTDHQGDQPSITAFVVNPLDEGDGWSSVRYDTGTSTGPIRADAQRSRSIQTGRTRWPSVAMWFSSTSSPISNASPRRIARISLISPA
jgi:hypothetical protein